MARQRMSQKNVRRIAAATGLDIVTILVRGGTDHRKDLCLADGTIASLWSDGTITHNPTSGHHYIRANDGSVIDKAYTNKMS